MHALSRVATTPRAVLVCAVAAIALARAWTRLRDIDLQVATYAVSSPLNFIWLHLNPALQGLDWPAGAADFRFSLPMVALREMVQRFGVEPTSLVWPYGFLQIVAFVAAVAWLAHVLFRDTICTLAIAAVVSVAPIAGVNFGNFGAGIGNQNPVLFYTLANALRIAGLACFIDRRHVAAAVLLLLACYTHLTLGLYMLVFIGCGALACPAYRSDPRAWLTAATIAVGLAPLAWRIAGDSTVTTGEIALADWVLMSQLFNWHWHPVALGLFGALALRGLSAMLFLAAGQAIARVGGIRPAPPVDRVLLGGTLGVLGLALVGVLLSDVWHVPIIMKLAPTRASELASLVMLMYYVAYLARTAQASSWVERACAGWALALLVLADPGIALLPLCALGLAGAWRARHRIALAAWMLGTLTLGALIFVGWSSTRADWHASVPAGLRTLIAALPAPLPQLGTDAATDTLLFGGGFSAPYLVMFAVAVPLAAVLGGRLREPAAITGTPDAPRLFAGAALVTMLVFAAGYARWDAWAGTARARAEAYLELQRWAFRHTSPDAVFMGDPAQATGWREYSARAYYGSLAELAHFATLYDSAPARFAAGLERVRAFGVDPLAVDRAEVAALRGGKYGISVLGRAVSEAFNTLAEDRLLAIARRFGVTHLIVERAKRPVPLTTARTVHENDFYRIYAVPADGD